MLIQIKMNMGYLSDAFFSGHCLKLKQLIQNN